MNNNRKRVRAVKAACAMMSLAAIGGTVAYLTDSETTTNTFTVGKVGIDLEEPNYPGNGSDEVTNIVPNEEVKKDPQVENTGDNKLVSFLRVYSPIALVQTAKDDGTKNNDFGPNEIFWMKDEADAITAHANHFSDKWSELTGKEQAFVQAQNQADGSVKYVKIDDAKAKEALWKAKLFHAVPQSDGSIMMASVAAKDVAGLPDGEKIYTITEAQYNASKAAAPDFIFRDIDTYAVAAGFTELSRDMTPGTYGENGYSGADNLQKRLDDARIYKTYVFGHKTDLDPKEKSEPIFDKVQLKNIIEGEIDTREQNIVIATYAIQSENVLKAAGAIDTSGEISVDDLGTIYDIFVKQGTAGKGDEAQADLYKNVENKDANITPTKDLNGNAADVSKKRLEIRVPDAKIQVGESVAPEFTASINGEVQSGQTITWSTANPAIAVIDNGQVKGVAIGTTELIGKWGNEANAPEARIEITVVNKEPQPTQPVNP